VLERIMPSARSVLSLAVQSASATARNSKANAHRLQRRQPYGRLCERRSLFRPWRNRAHCPATGSKVALTSSPPTPRTAGARHGARLPQGLPWSWGEPPLTLVPEGDITSVAGRTPRNGRNPQLECPIDWGLRRTPHSHRRSLPIRGTTHWARFQTTSAVPNATGAVNFSWSPVIATMRF
jgi:hypothetical protein